MTRTDSLLSAWNQLKRTPLPTPNYVSRRYEAPTYSIEYDLDWSAKNIEGLVADFIAGNTKIDYAVVASNELTNLNELIERFHGIPSEEQHRESFRRYIRAAQQVLEELQKVPIQPEGHLGFRAQVLRHFAFLGQDYGFHATEKAPVAVRFERDDVYIDLSWESTNPAARARSGRVLRSAGWPLVMSFVLSRRQGEQEDNDDDKFFIDDILFMEKATDELVWSRYDTQTAEGVASFIEDLAKVVRKYAQSLLRNEPGSWERLTAAQAARDSELSERMSRNQHDGG